MVRAEREFTENARINERKKRARATEILVNIVLVTVYEYAQSVCNAPRYLGVLR